MNPNTEKIQHLIECWLGVRLDPGSASWVRDRQSAIRVGDKKGLYLAFGMTPRKVGKSDLQLTDDEVSTAENVRPGWKPYGRAQFVPFVASCDGARRIDRSARSIVWNGRGE